MSLIAHLFPRRSSPSPVDPSSALKSNPKEDPKTRPMTSGDHIRTPDVNHLRQKRRWKSTPKLPGLTEGAGRLASRAPPAQPEEPPAGTTWDPPGTTWDPGRTWGPGYPRPHVNLSCFAATTRA